MKRSWWWTLWLLASFLILVGCGGGDDDDDDSDSGDDDLADDDATDDDSADDDAADDDADDDTDDDADDDAGDDDGDWVETETIDFEDYALGDLPSSWDVTVSQDAGAQVVELSKAASGQVVEIDDGDAMGDWLGLNYVIDPISTDLRLSFDVVMNDQMELNAGIGKQNSTLQGTQALIVFSGTAPEILAWDSIDLEYSECGDYEVGTPVNVAIEVDYEANAFDVLIDNVPAPCTGMRGHDWGDDLGEMMDFRFSTYGEPGFGGTAIVDNFILSTR